MSHPAFGQLQTTDPYDPSGAMYRSSTYPGYVNDPSYFNRPIFRPKGGANQMENYYRSVDSAADGLNDLGNRYDQQFRDYADSVGRNGPADNSADVKYYRDKQLRDQLYYQVQRERDPKKKAELNEQLKKISLEVSRDLAIQRPKGRSSTPPPSINSRSDRAASTARKLTPADMPASTSFLTPIRVTEISSTLPAPPRFSGVEAPRRSGASSPPPPVAGDDRSPSNVLERSLRSESRRGAPPIPGIDDSPR
jgi:hypothetical protein